MEKKEEKMEEKGRRRKKLRREEGGGGGKGEENGGEKKEVKWRRKRRWPTITMRKGTGSLQAVGHARQPLAYLLNVEEVPGVALVGCTLKHPGQGAGHQCALQQNKHHVKVITRDVITSL